MSRIITGDILEKRASIGEVVYKAAAAPPKTLDDTARAVRFVMSTEDEDRDHDIVRQAGLDLAQFEKNPIALLHHDRRRVIGTWSDVKKVGGGNKRTEGTLQFGEEGQVPASDAAFRMVQQGMMRACSIGMRIKSYDYRDAENPAAFGYGFDIKEAELVECSLVAIPANAAALAKSALQGEGHYAMALEVVEQVLDVWAKDPRTGMLVPRAEWERSYKALVDRTYHAPTAPKRTVESEKSESDDREAQDAPEDEGEQPEAPEQQDRQKDEGQGEGDDAQGEAGAAIDRAADEPKPNGVRSLLSRLLGRRTVDPAAAKAALALSAARLEEQCRREV